MLGVQLTTSWQSTRKLNNDDLKARVENCIGTWRSGKFMPLVSRPFSVNSYCLNKIWYHTNSVDLRAGDISAITSKIKSYCYQDLYQKPTEFLLYRDVKDGGLGLGDNIFNFYETTRSSHGGCVGNLFLFLPGDHEIFSWWMCMTTFYLLP